MLLREEWTEVGTDSMRLNYTFNYTNSAEDKIDSILVTNYNTVTQEPFPYRVHEHYNYHDYGELAYIEAYRIDENQEERRAYGYSWTYDPEIKSENVLYPEHYGMYRDHKYMILFDSKFNKNIVFRPSFSDDLFEFFYSEIEPSSTNETLALKNIYPYPNPTFFSLRLSGDINLNGRGKLEVYDQNGVKVITKDNYNIEEEISVNVLRAGLYFYKYSIGDEMYSGKFVKT